MGSFCVVWSSIFFNGYDSYAEFPNTAKALESIGDGNFSVSLWFKTAVTIGHWPAENSLICSSVFKAETAHKTINFCILFAATTAYTDPLLVWNSGFYFGLFGHTRKMFMQWN